MRICLITDAYDGASALGDLGSGFRGLATLLAAQSHDVTVLVTDLSQNGDAMTHPTHIAANLRLVFLSDVARADAAMIQPMLAPSKAYAVYRYLSMMDFDVAHFLDRGGLGFYAAVGKVQGRIRTLIVTHVTGPTRWRRRLTLDLPDIETLETETLEKVQFENSDLAITSTESAVGCVTELGWKLPRLLRLDRVPSFRRYINLNGKLVTKAIEPGQMKELVFFGSQDRSNGFELFIDIVRQIRCCKSLDLTLIGRHRRTSGELSASRLLRKLTEHRGHIRFLNDIGYEDSVRWLANRTGVLCIFPSSERINSAGIDECFSLGIPFIAGDMAAARELVDAASFEACLVPLTAKDFSKAIESAIENGMPALQSTLQPKKICEHWSSLYSDELIETVCDQITDEPLVSICITHYDRPALLQRAIDHLAVQTYKNIEIIIVDDGSSKAESIEKLGELKRATYRFPLTIIYSDNRYLGAARNLAARHAKGEFLLFHDDDNYAEPNEIEVFVQSALRTGCEILTSQCWIVHEEDGSDGEPRIERFFLGVGGAYSHLQNRFGDANALVRRDTFERLGGFSEIVNVGLEDWEFFLRAHLRGVKITVVPDPLFYYRVNRQSMVHTGDILRNRERIFSVLEADHLGFDSDLSRLAAKPIIEAEIRNQLLSLFEHLPNGDIHTELLDLDPASDLIHEKLALLGRDTKCRTGSEPSIAALPSKGAPDDVPVLLLSGWAFLVTGDSYVPKLWLLDGRFYETINLTFVRRFDVNAQFRLPEHLKVGFHAFIRPTSSLTWFRRRRSIRTSLRHQIATLDRIPARIQAHIDAVEAYRMSRLELPTQDWFGSVSIETDSKSFCILRNAEEFIAPSVIQLAFRHRFVPQAPIKGSLSAIVPLRAETRVWFD